jgi:hypothetical protein
VLRKALVVCAIVLSSICNLCAQVGVRKALLIGNGQYKADEQSPGFANLPMTAQDANRVGAMLEENGFAHENVTILTDQNWAEMIRDLSDFSKLLKPNDSALFYFSGHGFALDGENYIAPIGFEFGDDKASTIKAAISLKKILNSIGRAQTRVVILDACRDEPTLLKALDAYPSHSFGPLVPPQGSGSLVAFATSYGFSTSGASASGLSFYTQYLVKSLEAHPPTMKVAVDSAADLLTHDNPDAPAPGIYNEMRGDFPLLGAPTPPISDPDRKENPLSNLVSAAEFDELKAIDDFIGRKSEMELREVFDLPKMLYFNVELVKRSMAPQMVSAHLSAEIDAYFAGGQAMTDVRLLSMQNVNDRIQVNPTPGRVFIVNLPPKYLQSRSRLTKFCQSPELPSNLIKALKDFDAAVQANISSMIPSLNESLLANPRSILEDDDPKSEFFASAEGHYWGQFIQLEPKANAVSDAVRSAMGVK